MSEQKVRIWVSTPGNAGRTHYDVPESRADAFEQDHVAEFKANNPEAGLPSFSREPLFKVRR